MTSKENDGSESAGTAKARVLVIYTGGTIGMVPKDSMNPASPLIPGTKEEFLKYAPGLGAKHNIAWEIQGLPDEEPLDSSDVNASHWLKMASVIEQHYDKYDGFVILHGTDTMAYTASGLSFLLLNLAKPVVVTGSQLPISDERTDARLNLANALQIAGYKATGLPLVPEVVLCFGGSLLRGNRARKVSTSDLNGFDSPNYPPLGKLGEYIEIDTSLLRPPADNAKVPFFAFKEVDTDVVDMGLFPGLKAARLRALLESKDSSGKMLRGVVMRTFGAGNAPGDEDFLDVLKTAVKQGQIILNVTQCLSGMVEMGLYAASSSLLELGVISGIDITPEAALAKMFWILPQETDPNEIQSQLQLNQRGEQTEDLFDLRYEPLSDAEPTSIVKSSVRPPGRFRKDHLKRAIIRITGLSFSEVADVNSVHVFINFPSATIDTSLQDPHLAVTFAKTQDGTGQTLIADVTPTVLQFVEEGRAINFTMISTSGPFRFNGLFLVLFARS